MDLQVQLLITLPNLDTATRISLHPFRYRPYESSRLGVCLLTGLRIDARLLQTLHFVFLNATVRLFVRADCVALAKHSESVHRSILFDEILYYLDLSTVC